MPVPNNYTVTETMGEIVVEPNFQFDGPLADHLRHYGLPVVAQAIMDRASAVLDLAREGMRYTLEGGGVTVYLPTFSPYGPSEIEATARDVVTAYAKAFIKLEEQARITKAQAEAAKRLTEAIRRENEQRYGKAE